MAISTPPLDIGTYTDVGQIRARNEDSLQIYPEQHPAGQLFVVADGVGGENYGQEASQLAVRRIGELYYQLYEQYPQHPLDTLLREVLMRVNGEVYELALRFGSAGHMGTTAVVAVIRNTTLTVAWVGDSRVYVVSHKKGIARQITVDHSQVEDMVRSGQMSREDAERHPERNVLSRSLGGNPQVDVDSVTGELEQQDLIILCSDGLTRYVEKDLIAQHVLYHPSSQKAAEALGEMANNAGGKDNISIIVIHLGDRSAHNETMVQPDSLPASQVGNLAAVTRQNPNLARRPNRFQGNNLLLAGVIGGIIFVVAVVMSIFALMLNNGGQDATQTAVASTGQAAQTSEASIQETLIAENNLQTATQFAAETATASAPTPTSTLTPSETLLPVWQTENAVATRQLETQTAEANANQTAVVVAQQTSLAFSLTQVASVNQATFSIGTNLYVQRQTNVFAQVGAAATGTLPMGTEVIVRDHPGANGHTFTFNGQTYYYVEPVAGWVLADDLGERNPNEASAPESNPLHSQQPSGDIPENAPPNAGYQLGALLYINANGRPAGIVYLQPNALYSDDRTRPINHRDEVRIFGDAAYQILPGGMGQWWWFVQDATGQTGYIEEGYLTVSSPQPLTPTPTQ